MATQDKNILCKKIDFKVDNMDNDVIVKFIMDEFKKSNKKEIIVVNIGTDKCTGDSFAPFLGSYMEDNKFSIPFYGTLEEPIHALNIHKRIREIEDMHKNAFIIALDSSMSSSDKVGNITVRNKPVEAGASLDKDLPSVGDVSIIYNVVGLNSGFVGLQNARLGFILKAVREVYKAFETLEDVYKGSEEYFIKAI